ncbi:NFX1-type zinc finger-containing protein 1-like [Antedon mediterranea]|uniref:NFX1-type zinc finger-containing protein 1-like n=1 Tax=Antedon mediterranea TaxID=105859 RepID=UPI003AF70D84
MEDHIKLRIEEEVEAEEGEIYRGRSGGAFHSTYLRNDTVDQRRQVLPLNVRDLKSIFQKSDPVKFLSDKSDNLNELLKNEKMSDNVVEILLQMYERIFKCELSNTKKTLVDMLRSSPFLKKVLIPYVTHLGDRYTIDANKENDIQKNTERHLNLVWTFLLGISPGIKEINDFSLITTLLDVKSKELFEKRKMSQDALINAARFKKEAYKCISELKEADKKKRQLESAIREGIFDGPPPDDYRDIPILPTAEDLHAKELPFLRPNKIKGSYANQYHYLDVQFRLLREDFICPLREGIQTHLDNVTNPLPRNQRKRNTDVRLYYDVKVEHPVFSHKKEGVLYRVHFSLCNLKNVRWQNTKRLIYGSLVCLSHDNFQTLLFGTISDREESLLRHGRVDIKFHNSENMEISRLYTMVESTAFFESYRPVLQVLQQFNDDNNLPMEKYIIQASHNIKIPKYLCNTPRMMYDIGPLFKAIKVKGKCIRMSVGNLLEYSQNNNPSYMIDILDENAWPEMDHLALDESQISAVKSALTKELAVIQGPPGTGKTYIGLKVVETLLINSDRWTTKVHEQADEDTANSIIMVICYTNHALDQFLEGILSFCDNLVRIGGRSKSEKLEPFNLKKLAKKEKKTRKNEDHSINKLADSITTRMVEAEELIQLCDKYIISEFSLENIINSRHQKCLRDSRAEYGVDGRRSALPTWLGLLSVYDNDEGVKDVVSKYDEEDYTEDDEVEQDSNANIKTEFDMILDQREYDDVRSRQDYESKKKAIITALASKLAYDPQLKCKDAPLKRHQATVRKQLSATDDVMTEQEANRVNIRMLSAHDKWRLYRYWITKYKNKLRQVLFDQQQAYDQVVNMIKQDDYESKCKVLRGTAVVGMTTTGAAMNKELLNGIRPRIVVVEEAAEILEAHIVTSLTKQCEHLILIGDHQQLKPNPTVYKLATKFNLDTSLFERMLTNGVPCQKLSSQHRMRPQISEIMRKHFYSHLLDDESVKEFDNVKGVSRNLFFINHDIQEETVEDILSKSNAHEAEYCLAFAKYLYQQGYDASSITILTTYTGQVLNLKRLLKNKEYICLHGVYVSAVDNYQGEENEIILLSLVRSNDAGNIGFLKVSNRMCVALSRAKKGMFCIGNFKLLAEKNDLWMKIVNDMQSSNCIGRHIELYCQNHPTTKVKVSTAEEFNQCPMGGCKLLCETRLDCGHVCPMLCHPRDPNHKKYQCNEICVRICTRGHRTCYRRKCYLPCLPCEVMVTKSLECRHEVKIQCSQFEKPVNCTNSCERLLTCGHECQNLCFERCTSRCLTIVTKSFIPCAHNIEVKCYITSCQLPCEKTLACGHTCTNLCGDVCIKKCIEVIEKKFECGHTVSVSCFTPTCPLPCSRPTECVHSCANKCGDLCKKYHIYGSNNHHDEHFSCKMPCQKTLTCEHQCQRKCYETCSSYNCTELVKKMLQCTHEKEVACYVDPKELGNTCKVKVTKTRKCGHEQMIKCYESKYLDTIACLENILETLACGHTIKRICSETKGCTKKCSKLLSCGHKCKELCCKPCTDRCTEKVDKKLMCGHMKKVQCFIDVSEIATTGEVVCLFKQSVTLSCGHENTQLCYKRDLPQNCIKRCSKKLPCGHVCRKKCSEECSIDSCQEQCKTTLVCEHRCHGKCKDCTHEQIHEACTECCNKKLICGHNCQQSCSMIPCQPCKNMCQSGCWHKRCQRSCSDICEPCGARCKWECIHFKCTQFCDEFCNRKRCNQPCLKTLKCKHKCFGLCGEPCKKKCLTCDPASFHPSKYLPGKEKRPRYVLLHDCSHAIEVSTMDEYMDKDEGIRLKQCPVCHTIIRFNPRYGNVLKTINKRIVEIKQRLTIERSFDRIQNIRRKINFRLPCFSEIEKGNVLKEMKYRYGIKYERLLLFDIMTTMLKQVITIRDDLNQQSGTSYITDILQQLETIQQRIWNSENIASEQFVFYVSSEIQRINTCARLMKFRCKTVSDINKTESLLSILLHSKSRVTSEVMQEALDILGKDDQLPEVVVLVKETVS